MQHDANAPELTSLMELSASKASKNDDLALSASPFVCMVFHNAYEM
jgi:hypothetical protein